MPQFEVEVGGNIAPITKTLTDLKSRLKELKYDIENSTDAAAIVLLNKELKETENEIKRIKNIGPIIPPSAERGINAAAQATQNFGRVAQDLPFGFIGIQNNLNPLLESFQRLRQETGSNKAAFGALVGSLRGAGGLGLALSLVSSALVIYQNGIAGFNKKTKEAKDEADKLAETLKAVKSAAEVVFEGEGSAQAQIVQVQALAAALGDETRSQEERGRALEKLKSINKEYFGDLKLQEDSLRNLTPLVNEYTNALIAQSIVQELSSEIGKIGAIFVKQSQAVSKAKDALNSYKESLNIPAIDKAGNRTFILDKNIDKLNADLAKAQKELAPTTAKFNDLTASLRDATVEALKFKSTKAGADPKEEDALKKRLAALERIKKATTDVNALANIQEAIFDLQVKIAIRDDKKRLSAAEFDDLIRGYEKELSEAFKKQAIELEAIPKVKISDTKKLDVDDLLNKVFTNKEKIVVTLGEKGVEVKLRQEAVDVSDLIGKVAKATNLDKKIPPITLHDVRVKFLGGKQTKLLEGKEKINEQLSKEINESLENLSIDLTTTFADQIGTAFAESLQGGNFGDGLKAAAQAMLSVLGTTMQAIGRQVIAAAIKIKILKEVLEKWAVKNPGLAILAGVGLVAAGAALKNMQFSGPKFAQGGIVTGPTIGMVGEAGKEAIIPLSKLPKMLGNTGGQTVVIGGSLGIRGRELVAFLEQEQTRFNRLR
jgi:hypothetical protein